MLISRFMVRGILAAVGLAAPVLAQTQLDLKTQTKSTAFENAPYTRPFKAVASLPLTCEKYEVVFLDSAPAGSNIYACVETNTWVPQAASSGTVTIQSGGVTVGARQTQNFVAGSGILNAITDLGNRLNIQTSADTSTVLTKSTLQSGRTLLCQSPASSSSAFTCALDPTLTAYTSGMEIHWIPGSAGTSSPATLNVDILGAIPVVRDDGATPATGSDIETGRLYRIWFDGLSFRLPATSGGSSGGLTIPGAITATGAGGATTVTASTEWHAPLAACTATGAVLGWSTPPAGSTSASAGGCSGTNVQDATAEFAVTGTPSVQTSFQLPRGLTGTADVSVYYISPGSGATFTPAIDLVCVPSDGTVANDVTFPGVSYFAPGSTTSPLLAGSVSVVTLTSLTWPTGCTAGSRAHLRLIRQDTTGTATSVGVTEVVFVMRRVL